MSSSQKTTLAVFIGIVIIGLAIALISGGKSSTPKEPIQNVTVVDGTQYIDLTAKGGYQPQKTVAKAGMPTVIRFKTKGTFDCSASVRIPSLNINKVLPQSGTEEVNIGTSVAGTLQGSCGMGMYPFQIEFQS